MVEIDALKEQNPWWISRDKILEDEKVKEALERKNKLLYSFTEAKNIILVGPRQTGKTTYLKLLIYDLLMNKNVNEKKSFILVAKS